MEYAAEEWSTRLDRVKAAAASGGALARARRVLRQGSCTGSRPPLSCLVVEVSTILFIYFFRWRAPLAARCAN